VACVVALSWVIVTNVSMRSRIARLEAESRDLIQREERLRRELGEEQGRSRSVGAEIQKQQSGATTGLIAPLLLIPGVSRTELVHDKLVLPVSVQLVHTEIQLEPRDDYYFRFCVELRTRNGVGILTRSDLVRRRTTAGAVVAFDVPADALTADDYELTLKGVTSGRSADDIGSYSISVQRP